MATEVVILTLLASGSVSDYAEDDRSRLQQGIAAAAGVGPALVAIAIAAASVRITATIALPTDGATTAAAVQSSLASALGSTAASASTYLAVALEADPVLTTRWLPPPPPLPPPTAPPPPVSSGPALGEATEAAIDGGSQERLTPGAVAGIVLAALGCCALSLAGAYLWQRSRSKGGLGLIEVTSGRNPVKRNLSLNSRGQVGPILMRDGEGEADMEAQGAAWPQEFVPGDLNGSPKAGGGDGADQGLQAEVVRAHSQSSALPVIRRWLAESEKSLPPTPGAAGYPPRGSSPAEGMVTSGRHSIHPTLSAGFRPELSSDVEILPLAAEPTMERVRRAKSATLSAARSLLHDKGATPDKGADDKDEPQPIQRQHSASRTERLSASTQNEAVELTNLNDLIRFV